MEDLRAHLLDVAVDLTQSAGIRVEGLDPLLRQRRQHQVLGISLLLGRRASVTEPPGPRTAALHRGRGAARTSGEEVAARHGVVAATRGGAKKSTACVRKKRITSVASAPARARSPRGRDDTRGRASRPEPETFASAAGTASPESASQEHQARTKSDEERGNGSEDGDPDPSATSPLAGRRLRPGHERAATT